MKPRLLDLYCCAGGAGVGYARAGFDVTGVDIRPQPHYPFTFIQADALIYLREHGHEYDVIHASPPCQAYSRAGRVHKKKHPDLIPDTRDLLVKTGLPYIIENVKGAPLRADLILCGSMFGLGVIRHRYFESNIDLGFAPYTCSCKGKAVRGELMNYHNTKQRNLYIKKHGNIRGSDAFKQALQVEWMSHDESQEAIPPAYTEWIGKRILDVIQPALFPGGGRDAAGGG